MIESIKFPAWGYGWFGRGWSRRSLMVGLVGIALLVGGAAWLFGQPALVRLWARAGVVTHLAWQQTYQTVDSFWGPEAGLRRRGHGTVSQLAEEVKRLQWIAEKSSRVATTLEGDLLALQQQQSAARIALLNLAELVKQGQVVGASGHTMPPAQAQSLVVEKLQNFAAVQVQVALYAQTQQLHAAVAGRARQLQEGARLQQVNLAAELALFEAVVQAAEASGSSAGLAALRAEVQARMAEGEQIFAARQTLEKSLAEGRVSLTAVDALLLESAELTAQLRQLTVE